jgi:hypothetical protein
MATAPRRNGRRVGDPDNVIHIPATETRGARTMSKQTRFTPGMQRPPGAAPDAELVPQSRLLSQAALSLGVDRSALLREVILPWELSEKNREVGSFTRQPAVPPVPGDDSAHPAPARDRSVMWTPAPNQMARVDFWAEGAGLSRNELMRRAVAHWLALRWVRAQEVDPKARGTVTEKVLKGAPTS